MDETTERGPLAERLKDFTRKEFERLPERGFERFHERGFERLREGQRRDSGHGGVALAPPTLGYEIVQAVYTTESIYGRTEAGRRVDALYEKQAYDDASFEFREPTDREREIYHVVGPEHRLLYRDGAFTGWSYTRDADGRFIAAMRGLDFRYDDERHAQRLTVLVHDAIARERDDVRDSIPFRDGAMEGSRRFVATESIDGAFVAVGTRTRSRGDRVYESVNLEPGTELFVFGDAIFAPFGNPPHAHEIRFERPSDEAEPFVGDVPLPERVPFPADRTVEVPLTYERSHWIQTIERAPLRDYARDHARVLGAERGEPGRTHEVERDL